MSRLPRTHPGEERLLRYADGELPSREARDVRRHLEACWECRTELDRLQSAVGDCVDYRREVLQRHLPPPPEPWEDLSTRFEAAEKVLRRRSLAARVVPWLRAPFATPSRWFPAAATLVLLFVIAMEFRRPPSVQAAELLRNAVVAAEIRERAPRRIQVRTPKTRLTRNLGPAAQASSTGELEAVAALFRAARYDWADPLSARSYLDWHQQLPERRDEVSPDGDCYQIRTVTHSSELVEATIKLRQDDLRAVEGRFLFRNSEWVEMTELAEEPAAAIAVAPPVPGPDLATSRAVESFPAASAADEVAVLLTLHRLGADLGEPVEVRREGHQVVVSGTGVDAARQREIAEALADLPRVEVDFSRLAPPPLLPEPSPIRTAPATPPSGGTQAALEEYFGGRALLERFANDVLERTDTLMARAHALRRLEARFPAGRHELDAAGSRALAGIRRNHAAALARQAKELDQLLNPPLTAAGAVAAGSGPPPSVTVTELFDRARRTERLLAVMFGGAAGPAAKPSEVLGAIAELNTGSRVYLGRITIEDRD